MILAPTAHAQPRAALVVFAAASLTNAFEDIAVVFEATHPGTRVLFNFGGSSTLATQIVEGAPADVFASADTNQMQVVVDAQANRTTPQTFASNRLVLLLPADNPANITDLTDLARPGVRLVVAVPGVPIRTYTETVLQRLASMTNAGPGFDAAVRSNVVSEEDNVRQVVAKVALGEADAGFAYQTDVTADVAASVVSLPIPDELNIVTTYSIVALNGSADPALAQAFVGFVQGEEGQHILAQWGFGPPPTILVPGKVRAG